MNISVETLARLNPMQDLDQMTLASIAKQGETVILSAGEQLFELGDFDFDTFYLISGQMELLTKDDRTQLLKAGEEVAKNPISTLIPRQYTATAKTEVSVLKFNSDKLNYLMYGDGHSGLGDGSEIEDDLSATGEFEGEIFSNIFHGISTENTFLPPLPSMVSRILNLIKSQDMSFYQLEMALQHDPEIVKTVIDIANSDLYVTRQEVTTLTQVVADIGHRPVLLWVLALSMKSVFQTQSQSMQLQLNNLWIQSASVASIAAILARKTSGLDPASAFLCGLMQDIGVFSIYHYLDKNESKREKQHRLEKAVSDLRAELGALILDKWGFPEDCNIVAREAENWNRDPSSRADISDIIIIAKLHAFLQFPNIKPVPPMFKLPAFKKLGLRSYSPQAGMDILQEAKIKLIEIFGFPSRNP